MALEVKLDVEPKRKRKLKHVKKRIVFYSLATLVVLFLIFDIYCETKGLPASIERMIERKFLEKGITIKIKNARIGIFQGMVLNKVSFMDSKLSNWEFLTAESVKLSFHLSLNGLKIEKFSIHGGNLKLSVFPEAGTEGLSDILHFQNIESEVLRTGDDLEVKYATSSLNGFQVSISGSIRNVFENNVFVFQNKDDINSKGMTPSSVLSVIPLDARSYFYTEMKDLNKSRFKSMPLLQLHFDLNMKDVASSSMQCRVKIPSFKLKNFMVDEISGSFSLKEKALNLSDICISLGKDGQLKTGGALDLTTMVFNGFATGKADPSKYLKSAGSDLLEGISIPDGISEIDITIGGYSILTGSGNLRASFSIPRVSAFNIDVKDLKLNASLSIDEPEKQSLHIDKVKLTFNGDESLDFSGTFNSKAKLLSGDVSGRMVPRRFLRALDEKIRKELGDRVKLGDDILAFKGHIDKMTSSLKDTVATFDISLPSFQLQDSTYKTLTASASMNGKSIKLANIEFSTPEGNSIDGELEYYMPDDHVYVSLHSSGNPAFVYKTVSGDLRKMLKDLYDQVKWPEKNDLVEMTARINFFNKSTPFFTLAGTVVASDFLYNGVHFDYGTCTYYTDSDNLTSVPKIILQQAKDSAQISLAYDNRQSEEEIFPASELFTKPVKGTDKLYFEIESTLPGNSILKVMIPDWKHESLNISGRSPLKLSGMIDFTNDDNTYFNGSLTDAVGEWNGIPLSKICTELSMKKQIVSIKDMTAQAFNGDLTCSYTYDIKNNTGKVAMSVDDAEFAPLVKNLGYTDYTSKKIGTLSGEVEADLSYTDKDELLMNGKGKISVRDADIWVIPVLKGFTDMLGKSVISSEWGEISKADCEFTLEKDHFQSNSIQTDGNAIALSANGKYYWTTSESDFKVRAKVFKNVLPFELLSKLMDPLSWALEARLHGKGKDLQWEQISGLKSLFKK